MPEGRAGLSAKLTKATSDAIRELGSAPVTAKVQAADIAAVTGCPAESRECFDTIANTMEVREVVFGTVEPAASGDGFDVILTSIRPDETPYQRRIHLESQDEAAAVEEFEPKIRQFLLRQEPLKQPDLTVQQPSSPPPSVEPGQLDMSSFSVARVKPYAWALTGGGLLLIGTGIYMFTKASDKQDELREAPDQTVADLRRMQDLEDEGKRLTTLGNGFVISGAVVAIAGLVVGARQAMRRPEQKPATVTVTPVAVRGGAGLSLVIRGDL